MKPSGYLNKKAKEYFTLFASILKDRGMDREEYSTELSMLANEYANYEEAQLEIENKGAYVRYASGAQQIAPWVTNKEKSVSNILKLSPKFGLNPVDFEKIKSSVKEKVKRPSDKLNKFKK